MRRTPWAFAPLVAAVLWGGLYVVSKWTFAAIPPITLAFIRVSLGAATLLVVVRRYYPDRSFSRRDWYGFGVIAIWLAVSLATQFLGTDLTTAGEGSLITVTTPVFTVLMGVLVLGESVTFRRAAGVLAALVGTAVVVAGRHDPSTLGAGAGVGIAMLVLASVTWAGYTVWGAPLIRRYSALETATYSTALVVPLFALAVPLELHFTDASIGLDAFTLPVLAAIVYLGVAGTAVAWYCWYKGLEYLDAGTVAVFLFAQPVVGAALGAAFLGEPLGTGFLLGGAMMAAGIYVVSTDRVDEGA
ncbi:DMT family transporter [Halorubrum vacuolatum]|uniref:Threonine/homoserine efflux transporter RhtA n=1 Tax=Halorubrum vacuolatum TaxID=63740 RepID=A0A238UQI7_HALVU|nr:DMT family transporter [Halorubrum vacuolatum]SNR24248.1 Threonine/homoserine efflux transporter RhtA [Halorubrum vacuolatum]